ncbi:hypothetical protein evm_013052 [Chilo suppressalis]|nr:hypothetical protein evm_013052 [Chilo suppressalis]
MSPLLRHRLGRLGHDPPRGPSAGWWVRTTADAAGTNGLTCLPKHGGARDSKYLVTHPMTDHCESPIMFIFILWYAAIAFNYLMVELGDYEKSKLSATDAAVSEAASATDTVEAQEIVPEPEVVSEPEPEPEPVDSVSYDLEPDSTAEYKSNADGDGNE